MVQEFGNFIEIIKQLIIDNWRIQNNMAEYFHSSIYIQTKGKNINIGLNIQKQKIEL